MENYYSILEISESATREEITQAYRLLLQVWHPDRFHHNPTLLDVALVAARRLAAAEVEVPVIAVHGPLPLSCVCRCASEGATGAYVPTVQDGCCRGSGIGGRVGG